MSWFIKKRQQKTAVEERTVRVPEGLWVKCEACKELIYRAELVNTRKICPKCGYHFRIGVDERLASMITEATDRAEHLSETQSAAALKLDSAEMAVNRLVAEIEAVMTVPGPAHLASTAKPVAQAPATQRSNLAA